MLTYLFYIIYLFYVKKTKDKYAWLVFEIDFLCLKKSRLVPYLS